MPSSERRLSQQDLHSGCHLDQPSYLRANSSATNPSTGWGHHQSLESQGQHRQSLPRSHHGGSNGESLFHRPSSPPQQSEESYYDRGQPLSTITKASSVSDKTDREYRVGQEYPEGGVGSGRPHHMAFVAAPIPSPHYQQQQQQQHQYPYYHYLRQPQNNPLGYGDDNDDGHDNDNAVLLHDKYRNNSISSNTSSTSSASHLHMQNHPGSNNKHPCRFPTCGWSFKRFEHLKRHMLVHTKERPFICEFQGCDKSFSRSDNFSAHLRTHTKKSSMQMRKLDRQHQQFRDQQQPHQQPHHQQQPHMMSMDPMGYLRPSSTDSGIMSPTNSRYEDFRQDHPSVHHYHGAANGFMPTGVMSTLVQEQSGGVMMGHRHSASGYPATFHATTADVPGSGTRTSLSTNTDLEALYSSQVGKLAPRTTYHEDSMNDRDSKPPFGLIPNRHQHSSSGLHPLDNPVVTNAPETETAFGPIKLDLKAVSNNPKDVELHNQHNIKTESLHQYNRHQHQSGPYKDHRQHHRQDSSSRERFNIGDENDSSGATEGGHRSMVVLGSSHDEPNPNPNGESPEQPSRKSPSGSTLQIFGRQVDTRRGSREDGQTDRQGGGKDGMGDEEVEDEEHDEKSDDGGEEGEEGEEMDRGQAAMGLGNGFSGLQSHFVPGSGGGEGRSPPPPSISLRSHSEGNLSSIPFFQAEGMSRTEDSFIERHSSFSSSSGGHGGSGGEYHHRHSISGYGPSAATALSSLSPSIMSPQPAMWPSTAPLHHPQTHDLYGLPPMQYYQEELPYSHHQRFPLSRTHLPPTAPYGHHHHPHQGRARPMSSAKNHGCSIPGCMKRFKRLEHLKRHIKTHTLERPFACTTPGCNKRFSRSDNLSQHIKTHQRQLMSKSHWKQQQQLQHQMETQRQSYHQHQHQPLSQHPHAPPPHHTSSMEMNMEASGHGGHLADVSRSPPQPHQHPGHPQQQLQQMHPFHQHRPTYQESAEY
ncbi:hypothetical protein EMPS_09523 [Entomortierella parvispora]|uniref:C2H2-type domain-containing protein n=1 Tax=Entomortierella parvispora TaxID=205924 RepID=A0A9P3HI50_9FUNG|nr:hypothetical protein EMPS_09523 [Entomortierella parvispora]